ncbi:hypothetical protein LDENG_00195010 [Lucifuga dentata]|nr:hypothetical protein LDENG_00195010 [Lucifuga dentata]
MRDRDGKTAVTPWKRSDQFQRSDMSAVVKGPYHPFSMFDPNVFSFQTCYVTDNHFPKHKAVFQLS